MHHFIVHYVLFEKHFFVYRLMVYFKVRLMVCSQAFVNHFCHALLQLEIVIKTLKHSTKTQKEKKKRK